MWSNYRLNKAIYIDLYLNKEHVNRSTRCFGRLSGPLLYKHAIHPVQVDLLTINKCTDSRTIHGETAMARDWNK
jgi:hypothetical protein